MSDKIKEKDDQVLVLDPATSGTVKIEPLPMSIIISNPLTQEVLGEFKEKDGLLIFEGKVDESGKIFVDFICKTFEQRIKHLYNQ